MGNIKDEICGGDQFEALAAASQGAAYQPAPCCMWCGKEKPERGWYYLDYPKALCTRACFDAFQAAI